MKRYIEHIKTKEPHERRKHAMQLSGALVGLFFVAWVATFSLRIGSPAANTQGGSGDPTQTASAANSTMLNQGQDAGAQLEVSTTSVYSY